MHIQDLTAKTVSTYHLQRLFMFRNSMIVIELLLITLAIQAIDTKLPLLQMLLVIVIYALFNMVTWIKLPREAHTSPLNLFLQLSVDVVVLTLLLYYTGGSNNPFVSLFLLPLLIVAAILPKPYIWTMAALTTCCYAMLMLFHYTPASSNQHSDMAGMAMQHSSTFNAHAMGMALSFLFSVAVILFFVVSMAEALRNRERKLAEAHEKNMRDEHVVALGTLAAGAAHELGTPLGTMAVLTKEMQNEYADDEDLVEQIDILRSQVNRCKATIAQMSDSVGQQKATGGKGVLITTYIRNITEQWQQEHPDTTLELDIQQEEQAPTLVVDDTFKQVLVNLLDNATEASPEHIRMLIHWDEQTLHIGIRDFGEGLSPEVKASMGKPFFTTKTHGQGLGLYLAQAVVSRMGGTIAIDNHEQGGAYVHIQIPLQDIKV